MEGTEAYDLTGVPDEELEELATLYDVLQSSFTRVAEDIPLATFWSSHAASPDAFPALVVVAPFLGVNTSIGPSSGPITLTVSRSIHLYPVADSGAVPGLLEQLAVYERIFVGAAFTGTATAATFEAGSVFVDDETWAVLAAAAAEELRRASP